ncbi:MAG: DUF5615 family PIN-like protein [Chthoniobacterales bacterium]
MRVFLDQMFHLELAEILRDEGHDVATAGAAMKSRADDAEILALAGGESRVLITRDGDFGDWAVLPLRAHAGVIRVETKPTTTGEAAALLVPFLASASAEELRNYLVIISRSRIRRIRTAP